MEAYDEAQSYFIAAGNDIAAIRAMGNASDFSDEIYGFHAQQAAEKLFKAWLAHLQVQFPKTHDLPYLFRMLCGKNAPADVFEDLLHLNPFAVQYRYDSFDELDAPLDRQGILFNIEKLQKTVNRVLGGPASA